MTAPMETIFEKIVAGKIPCTKLYEDDNVLSFLDISPLNKGHALVVSKKSYPDIFDIPDEVLSAVALASKKVALAIKKVTGCTGVNIMQNNRPSAGQEVIHYHVHVIPRFDNDGHKFSWKTTTYGGGEAAKLGKEIREAI